MVEYNAATPFNSYDVGSTPTTGPFVITFAFDVAGDLYVTIDDVPTTNFTVGAYGEGGGTITLGTAVSNVTVAIGRDIELVPTGEQPAAGALNIQLMNSENRRLYRALQDRQYEDSRSVRVAFPETLTALPAAPSRANKALAFDDDGQPFMIDPPAGLPASTDNVFFKLYGIGTLTRALSGVIAERVSVLDWIPSGLHAAIAAGTNTVDLTLYIQACFDECAGKRVIFPRGVYRQTSALLTKNSIPYFEDGAYLKPEGSGYWAITLCGATVNDGMGGQIGAVRVKVQGDEFFPPDVDGILEVNAQTVYFERLSARYLNGAGIEHQGAFDCWIGPQETLSCGTATKAAISYGIYAVTGDACNECTIVRNQPENSNGKALSISGSTTFCTILRNHIEGIQPASNIETVLLGGNRCTYLNTRISHLDDSNGFVTLEGSSSYMDLTVENRYVEYNPQGIGIVIIKPDIADLRPDSAGEQGGRLQIIGGELGDFTLQAGYCDVQGTGITGKLKPTLMTGSCPGNETAYIEAAKRHFKGCEIADIEPLNTTAAISLEKCTLAARTSWPLNVSLTNMGLTPTLDPPSGATLRVDGCSTGHITVASTRIDMFDSTITGNLTSTGTHPHIFINSGCNGTVSGTGTSPPDAGYYFRGQRCDNLQPSVGSPIGWQNTASGSPGTWSALPNL